MLGGGSGAERAPNDDTTRSLIQTRNLTLGEKRKLSRAISRLHASKNRPWHTLLSTMAAIGLAISVFALLDFVLDALLAGVEFSQKALFGLVIGGGALLAIIVRCLFTDPLGRESGAGDRYTVTPDGFTAVVQGVTTFCPWPCVRDIKVSGDHILVRISASEALALCKAAFASQGVAEFGAELERRWRQVELPAPSPASDVHAAQPSAAPAVASSIVQLRQTRELTQREYRDFMRFLRNNPSRKTARKWLTAVGVAWWLAAAWFSFSIVAAIDTLRAKTPDLAWQLAIAAVMFWIAMVGIGKAMDYVRARQMRRRDIGNTFSIEADGFCTKSPDEQFKAFWHGIPAMVEDADYLLVMLNETVGSIIVKAAFEGQDVATFCAEAQRRWKTGQRAPAA